MKLDAAAFAKWEEWGQKIHDDLSNHVINPRQMFRGFNEMAKANADHIVRHEGGVFFDFVAHGYITQVAMGIRKHSKNDDTISFMRVLEQIKACAPQFTYEVYLGRHPIDPTYINWQKPTFTPFTDDGNVVSVSKVEADINLLKTLTASVVQLCDKELAHLDKKGYTGTVTFGELEACVDAFDKLLCKYFKLVTKSMSGYSTLEATILSDWENIFTVPMDLRNTTWKDAAIEGEFHNE